MGGLKSHYLAPSCHYWNKAGRLLASEMHDRMMTSDGRGNPEKTSPWFLNHKLETKPWLSCGKHARVPGQSQTQRSVLLLLLLIQIRDCPPAPGPH